MAYNYKQGIYKPVNPSKYKGDVTKIVYRSGWERNVFSKWDRNPNILAWAAEEVIVPYYSPLDKKLHRYFVDGYFEYIDTRTKQLTKVLVEIKPHIQCFPPPQQQRQTKQWMSKAKTFVVNKSKWDAAVKFAGKRGWRFVIMTEKGILNWVNGSATDKKP